MMRVAFYVFCLFLLFRSAVAQDDFDFGEEAPTEKAHVSVPLHGKVNMESAYQTGDPRWIRLGPSVFMVLDYQSDAGLVYGEATGRYNRAYRIEGDSAYTRRGYEWEGILREVYWKKDFGPWTCTAGNVIVVWGKGDLLPVTDVISPLDRTQAFFANPEETRLGQNVLKLDYFGKHSQISFIAIPYPMFDRITDRDHPYSYTDIASTSGSVAGVDPTLLRLHETNNSREVEGGIRFRYEADKAEAAVMGGWFHNRSPLIDVRINSPDSFRITREYKPFAFAGATASYAMDPILWKMELGYSYRRGQQRLSTERIYFDSTGTSYMDMELPNGIVAGDELDGLIGLDYNIGDLGMAIAEMSIRHVINPTSEVYPDRDLKFLAIGYTKKMLRDDLELSSFVFFFEDVSNILYRVQLRYNVNDRISLMGLYTGIGIGAYPQDYSAIADYDRVDIVFESSFDLSR